ncbi:hypothetical protein BOX15_Mlig015741g1 [Macrostomum lignano]|uniref:CUB domain-containing protein n=2 Tax=Macrostomum lignano TaxID=282301 RepID=A0A267FE03_9PLAT|nr:hypothetical protein BOX15_Mlig015741g1 [Macrostomum lignano]
MFPRAYPLSVSCLLYVFVAADNQIVRLKFERFELKPRIDGRCHDYVRLFLNSATAELSSEDRPSHELCGADLPQAEFYSSGRVLMLEFHSRLSPAYQTADSIKVFQGFKGSFSFEPAGQYKTDGALVGGSTCDYEFHSEGGATSGRFFSPGYPQNYPPGILCAYRFVARPGERVRLDFHRVSLGGRPNASRCLDGRLDDKDIMVVTGGEQRDAPLLARFTSYCDARAKEQVVSPAGYLLLRFEANSDDVTGQGFAGRFGFVAMHRLQPTAPIGYGLGAPRSGPGTDKDLFNYTMHFDSRRQRQGVIASLHFPNAYPKLCRITYQFTGQPGETVRVSFESFQLDEGPTGSCTQAYPGDKLLIYDGDAVLATADGVRCGSGGQVDDIWSTGRSLTLVFESDGRSSGPERGFRASFYFQRRSNPHLPPPPPPPQLPQVEAARCREPSVITGGIAGVVTSVDDDLADNNLDTGCAASASWMFVGVANATERVVVEIQQLGGVGNGGRIAKVDKQSGSASCAADADQLSVTRYVADATDAVETVFCSEGSGRGGSDSGLELPVRVMSAGSVTRLLAAFRAGGSGRVRGGVRLAYGFVQDFGVLGRFKNQNWPLGCHFSFYSRQNRSGRFTSPNYPHPYPEQLTCVYEFHSAGQAEQIRVEFANFDTEASPISRWCNPKDSDYVVAEDCQDRSGQSAESTSRSAASLSETRCGRPPVGSRFSFVRRAACLRVTFVSNARRSGPGFLANYYFDRLPGVIQLSQQDDQVKASTDDGSSAATPTAAQIAELLILTAGPLLAQLLL